MRFLILFLFVSILSACNPVTPQKSTSTSMPTDTPESRSNKRQKLLFTLTDGHSSTINIINMDGSELKKIGDGYNPSWSPDGQRVAYQCAGICVVNINSSQNKKLAPTPMNGSFQTPSWSPDGKKIAFIDYRNNTSVLSVMNEDGTDLQELVSGFYSGSDPIWSPDGRYIAFNYHELDSAFNIGMVASSPFNHQITIVNPDKGQAWMCATNNTCLNDGNPVWSPLNDQLAFVATTDKGMNICLANLDGTIKMCPTEKPGGGWNPAWLPDGHQIIFLSDRTGVTEIYKMDAGGSNQKSLHTKISGAMCSAWSSNREKIAFSTEHSLYVMNIDGSQLTKLFDFPKYYGCPKWQP